MKNLLTTAEAGASLGVDPSRIRQLILAGDLPAIKHGRDLAIDPIDLEKLRIRPGPGRRKKSGKIPEKSRKNPGRLLDIANAYVRIKSVVEGNENTKRR